MGTKAKAGLLQGTLDMLILKALFLGPLHGYGIGQRIAQISGDELKIEEGSLYPGGRLRKQSAGEVLQTDPCGPQTANHRGAELGAPSWRHHEGPSSELRETQTNVPGQSHSQFHSRLATSR